VILVRTVDDFVQLQVTHTISLLRCSITQVMSAEDVRRDFLWENKIMSTRTERIHEVLRTLVTSSPDIEGAALVTTDGLPLASALPQGTDEDRVSAMAAAALSMGSRTATELRRGTLEQVYVKGTHGYVVLMQAGEETVLETISTSEARLGLLLYEMKLAAKELAALT
jgi:predicted regulator of Ras-like GTPase activity (Roadblock/LC7/MglB family)